MARTTIAQRQAPELLCALEAAYDRLNADGLTTWTEQLQEVIYQCRCSLEIEGLAEIQPIVEAALGYDPLEPDTRPKGEKRSGHTRSEARGAPPLQDLRRKI